jgi:hypothetical protein
MRCYFHPRRYRYSLGYPSEPAWVTTYQFCPSPHTSSPCQVSVGLWLRGLSRLLGDYPCQVHCKYPLPSSICVYTPLETILGNLHAGTEQTQLLLVWSWQLSKQRTSLPVSSSWYEIYFCYLFQQIKPIESCLVNYHLLGASRLRTPFRNYG